MAKKASKPKTEETKPVEGAAVAEVFETERRLSNLKSLLATPGRGLDVVSEQSETITGAIRQAIQAERARGRSLASIAEAAGCGRAGLHRFMQEGKDLNGTTLDKLAATLGLVVREKARTTDQN